MLCQLLRGESPNAHGGLGHEMVKALLVRGDYHGILPLLYDRLLETGGPAELLDQVHRQTVARVMWELRHRPIVSSVLAALDAIDAAPVVFKGTALAYALYPRPALRTRGDTDIIVAPAARSRAQAALEALGFRRDPGVSGEFVSYQACYTIAEGGGRNHSIDLHWRINNSELLSRLFTHDELIAQACPLPLLDPHALIASPVHALLLACMHRATHKQNPYYVDDVAYFGGDRLIWLYDIHLLVGQFGDAEWEDFCRTASSKGLRAICLEGMQLANARFNTVLPEAVVAKLAVGHVAEPAAFYLNGGSSRQQWMDFRAIDGPGQRLRFLSELVFPTAEYMRLKYPAARPGWLPWLYLRRALAGISKRFRSRAAQGAVDEFQSR